MIFSLSAKSPEQTLLLPEEGTAKDEGEPVQRSSVEFPDAGILSKVSLRPTVRQPLFPGISGMDCITRINTV